MFIFVRLFVWKYLTRKYSLLLVNKVLHNERRIRLRDTATHGVVSVGVGGVQPVLTQGCAYTSSIHSVVIVWLVVKL